MVGTSDQSHPDNLISSDILKSDKVLKSAAIYGANASGKSNVLHALSLMGFMVMNSHSFQRGLRLPYFPFKFDKGSSDRPTALEVAFIEKGKEYRYGFEYDGSKIITEFLYHYPKGRKATVFERHEDQFIFKTDKAEQERIKEMTPENVLYVSRATQMNYQKTHAVLEWFGERLRTVGPSDLVHPMDEKYTLDVMESSKDNHDAIVRSMTVADLGIVEIETNRTMVTEEELDNLMNSAPPEFRPLLSRTKGRLMRHEVKMKHAIKDRDGHLMMYDLDLREESEGTKKFFMLMGYWVDALRNGKVLAVDEIEVKLHHHLVRFLIELFHDPQQNTNGAQLIFTSHDTNLLDLEFFRRDQIWFTEKDVEDGCTRLYSLSEFSERKDRDIQKGYLTGRYGAIPVISGKVV
ncbi:MAG: ATP-binding protein [Methanomassiliicoccales archaeon]|nr:MAG: ATP-binding protein [Methanomassiliicoccales archaeon]